MRNLVFFFLVGSRTFVNSNSTRSNNHEYIPNVSEDWDNEIDENQTNNTKQWLKILFFSFLF